MDYEIKTDRAWRYRHPKRGREELAPGTYRVPEDLPEAVARRAIDEGVAIKSVIARPSDVDPVQRTSAPVRRTRKAKAKGPAPENRALFGAPENKQAVH